jgi:hypothetical protein
MHVSRSTQVAILCLPAFLFQTDRFIVSAVAVPPGMCLYSHNSMADHASQIACAQSVRTLTASSHGRFDGHCLQRSTEFKAAMEESG